MKEAMSDACIVACLQDAGCDSQTIQCIMEHCVEGNIRELMRILSQYRKQLLDKVHVEERRICCLDYLIYQLNQQEDKKL